MTPKRLLFVSGTRADFGKLKPLIEQVKHDPGFEYSIFATGMHMLTKYGATVLEIHRAGFDNVFPYINQDSAVNSQMDLVLANTITGLGLYLREFKPDLLVVHGDRIETLAAAIAGALNNILVAHVEGGEVSGTIDELLRHSVSKLSHLHFVSNGEARTRLVQMGETPESIMVIGSPDIDVMLSDRLPTLAGVKARYDIPFDRYAIVMYHPVTSELGRLRDHVSELTRGLQLAGGNYVAIYPNNDTGSDVIVAALTEFRDRYPNTVRLIPSMRFEYFLTLLKHAQAIVGNSSAGIREAPVYGVPTVNTGTRQMNRFQHPSILNVAEDAAAVAAALADLPSQLVPSRHFGSGQSAERFITVLRGEAVWETPRQKYFRDLGVENLRSVLAS
ncbi:MAG: UDP-N-acetylglucosamine 2-epimerase [Vicinamibacterales bacterium]